MIAQFLLDNNIEESEKENFKRNLILNNIEKGKILAITIIVLELIFIIIAINASFFEVNNQFQFDKYLMMYSIMLFINVFLLLFFRKFKLKNNLASSQLKKLEIGIVVYITLIMSWGSIISLMDQKLYGQLTAFMVNMITCSVIYFLDNKKILVPYFFSVLIIFIGLPYFQSSREILIGHYVNLCVFVFISWLASRIIYSNYCNDFKSKSMLEKSKNLLKKEIQENRKINDKLARVNLQLKQAALIDELTGIPNRRSFRNYIDSGFKKYVNEDSTLSILIMDIDFFKQFNDNYGHEEGDKALIQVANQINSTVRNPSEFVARWGGEEFIYALYNTNEKEIDELAETIKQKVCELRIVHEFSENGYISVSIGTSTIQIERPEDVSKGINIADKALYLAKNSGRNCVKNMSEIIALS